jgi:hypothetical protein
VVIFSNKTETESSRYNEKKNRKYRACQKRRPQNCMLCTRNKDTKYQKKTQKETETETERDLGLL